MATERTLFWNQKNGDSGGGITTSLDGKHYLVGLVSFGSSCSDLIMGSSAAAQASTYSPASPLTDKSDFQMSTCNCSVLMSFGVRKARKKVHTDLAFYTADIDEFLDMKVEDRKEKWEQ
ncbi:hypothetical protein KIN20_002770 [Parelaphostrongylus tenuis]|uniref:Peptidase S1 domain-containing protein n=1 Tax=Parelaphostrongylus tenuis TaxID=148309 RepID=A0AAD5QGZ9_PARTN|nr:hypothetical protein KIN20_002770 [Parelaphostrongylus tenuis]